MRGDACGTPPAGALVGLPRHIDAALRAAAITSPPHGHDYWQTNKQTNKQTHKQTKQTIKQHKLTKQTLKQTNNKNTKTKKTITGLLV